MELADVWLCQAAAFSDRSRFTLRERSGNLGTLTNPSTFPMTLEPLRRASGTGPQENPRWNRNRASSGTERRGAKRSKLTPHDSRFEFLKHLFPSQMNLHHALQVSECAALPAFQGG